MAQNTGLDLSTCKTADDVRTAAIAHYELITPLPIEPVRPPLHRPSVITAGSGRLWFEVVFERSDYRNESPDLHLRSFKLDGDERISLDEMQAMQGQLAAAIDAYTVMSAYGEARKAWKQATEKHKDDQRLYIDTVLKTWADQQKKK